MAGMGWFEEWLRGMIMANGLFGLAVKGGIPTAMVLAFHGENKGLNSETFWEF